MRLDQLNLDMMGQADGLEDHSATGNTSRGFIKSIVLSVSQCQSNNRIQHNKMTIQSKFLLKCPKYHQKQNLKDILVSLFNGR